MVNALGRWAPAAAAAAGVVSFLLATDTPTRAVAAYAAYAVFAVLAPGTLLYRALRARPHTLVEDLTYGAVVGVVAELGAWAAYSAAGAQRWLWTWPLLVAAVFAVVPRLRRHWWVRGYRRVPAAWSWAVAAVVVGFTWYLAEAFLWRNPVLPAGEDQRQYIDLAFQLSLAGEATHRFPPHVPQVAGEPLHYHWFGFAHMAAASLVSGVDLPTVFFRLAVPALCALAALAVAVTGWRVTRRPAAGAVAAALLFTVGEFGYENGVRQLFGTQATFIVWGSPSMTYSWVLLLPLIAAAVDRLAPAPAAGGAADRGAADRGAAAPAGAPHADDRGPGRGGAAPAGTGRGGAGVVGGGQATARTADAGPAAVPPLGRGAWVLLAALLLASTGAKASSVPVFAGAAGCALLVALWRRRRRAATGAVVVAALAAQAWATAVLFAFERHGVTFDPASGLAPYVAAGSARDWLLVGTAFVLNMHLRLAGVVPLLWRRRRGLDAPAAFLVGGALTGVALYLAWGHPGSSNQYFLRAGFAFGVLASAWGLAEVAAAARLTGPWRRAVVGGVLAAGALLVLVQVGRGPSTRPRVVPHDAVLPLLLWAAALAGLLAVGALAWRVVGGPLRGRGGVVLLGLVLVAGAPGLVMDARVSRAAANGGAYVNVAMPRSRVDAARYLHAHSGPRDIVATNAHCREVIDGWCDSRSFWLSAYAARTVLVEGWAFAPRAVTAGTSPFGPFWDAGLFAANASAFTAPTAAGLEALRDRHGVRWLVADRRSGTESAALAVLAERRFDNGAVAVYRLR
ncbi:MAG TPA: hypothetical protein VFY17_00345 [Pilimelia sp.]|nr:hypothetical protein [Pilimelia sp.]